MLVALFIELKQSNAEKVLMEDVQDRMNTIRGHAAKRSRAELINTSLFRQIVKRMQAFGLVTMEIMPMRITDNVFLQTTIYEDEIITAFGQIDYFRNVAEKNHLLGEMLRKRDELNDLDVVMK